MRRLTSGAAVWTLSSMAYQTQIIEAARQNTDFRRELYTTAQSQLVLMSVLPGDDIGLETHDLDQVLVFVSGTGKSLIGGRERQIGAGDVAVVPAGTAHNFINTGSEPLKLFTVYAPPEHAAGTVHRTKAEAERAEALEHGHGRSGSAAAAGLTVGSLRSR
jgi:mannose-6-phosphate isomerase-like protein (cupin superfamily)